jgi:tartrate dehydrogenase/decarboxylase/D-malate dehydrogenase
MKRYRVAVLAGDGIGKEVTPEGLKALRAAEQRTGAFRFEFEFFDWGSEYYIRHGRMMPADALEVLKEYEALYFGAIGLPGTVPDHVTLWEFLLPIRKGFQQYINLRPCRLLPGITGPLRDKGPQEIDLICVRENSEGEYSGAGGRVHLHTEYEVAIQTSIFTRKAVERVLRYGFELSRSRPKKRLVSATKSNAMQHGMVFWDEVFRQVAADYPDVHSEQQHVDALAARFVTRPETLDVVVGSNLFADILTDLGGALMGSLGMAPSANLNIDRTYPSMFEPVHGSAPDIAGKGIANPIAMVWCASLMLDHLGEKEAARLVMQAIEKLVAVGEVLTPDLGGSASTVQVGDALCNLILS